MVNEVFNIHTHIYYKKKLNMNIIFKDILIKKNVRFISYIWVMVMIGGYIVSLFLVIIHS
jgi:hypothetical protein